MSTFSIVHVGGVSSVVVRRGDSESDERIDVKYVVALETVTWHVESGDFPLIASLTWFSFFFFLFSRKILKKSKRLIFPNAKSFLYFLTIENAGIDYAFKRRAPAKDNLHYFNYPPPGFPQRVDYQQRVLLGNE